jgi:hypothetical protein
VQRLTPEQRREVFSSFERFAYHLEMRDWYGIDEEKERFARWRAGEPRQPIEEELWRPWHTLIRDAIRRGAVVRRARIVSEPVTDYIRFEWEGTYQNLEAGEEVRWLSRRLASGIALPGNDFWLFDDKKLLVNHFTGDGGWVGNEIVIDPAVIELCHSAFDAVWRVATPHGEYQPG